MRVGEWLRRIAYRMHGRRNAEELEEEMRLHMELRASRLRDQGEADPLGSARRRFGNVTAMKEAAWETWAFLSLERLWRDLRFAARVLRKTPGVSAIAVISLALGIGANTAVFSIVDAVLLRPLPYPSPERLASVASVYKAPGKQGTWTWQDGKTWEAVRDRAAGLDSAVFFLDATTVNFGNRDRVEYVRQQRVGAGFFRVLGMPPLYGREFTREEDRPGGPAVAVISYGLWQRALGADRSLLNRPILLRGEPYVVVGVMPPEFRTAALADVWTPLRASAEGEGSGANYQIVARLKPGISWARAVSEIELAGAERLRSVHLDAGVSMRLTLLPLQSALAREIRTPLLLLWSAVGVVVLIACINVAGLMLARSGARRREIATRMALGGGAAEIMGQLMVESLLLAAFAGGAGLAAGNAVLSALRVAARNSLNVWQTVGLDARVFLASGAVTLLTAVLFGLYPAFEATRADLRSGLMEAGGRGIAGARRRWPRRLLIVGEVSLGVALLVTAGLLARSFLFLRNQPAGFDGTQVVTATLPLQDARYQTAARVNLLFRETLSRMRSMPGVESAAFGLALPYERGMNSVFSLPGGPGRDTTLTYVTPEYFRALDIPVLSGRAFSDRDGPQAGPVAMVNRTFVRMYFGGQNPVGRSIRNGAELREIVGVTGDIPMKGSLRGYAPMSAIPIIFVPAAQVSDDLYRLLHTWFTPSCIVRGPAPVSQIAAGMRQAIAAVDPLLPFSAFRSIGGIRSATLAPQRFQALIMSVLAGVSLFLAAIGIYGVIAQLVVERTRELGIRLALGATRWEAVRSAARPGILFAAAGCLAGAVAGLGVARAMRSIIWGVSAADPATFLGAAALLMLTAAAASLIPAARIVHLNCVDVLRNE